MLVGADLLCDVHDVCLHVVSQGADPGAAGLGWVLVTSLTSVGIEMHLKCCLTSRRILPRLAWSNVYVMKIIEGSVQHTESHLLSL